MKKLVLSTIVAFGLLAIPVSAPTTWTSGIVGATPAAAKCTPPGMMRDENKVATCDKNGW